MKKNDLIRKLSVIGAMVLVASTMVACSSSANYAPTSAATADDYSYAQGKNAFYETTTTSSYDLYDDADYYAEEAEYYDEGGYSVGNMSTPITETQANASVAKNRKLIKTVDMTILAFSAAFVIVGLLGKVVGCGLVAKLLKYNTSDALKIGVGMMTRGEVALIVAQRGLKAEIIDSRYFTAVILLIILSSILTPIILKAIYASDESKEKQLQ